jgi:pimeloyl-ACP methyl ester carboxylesterase
MLHGTSGEHGSFDLMQPYLVGKFTLIAIDRRGHGTSGDAKGPYAIEREFEDAAAVIDSLDEPASLFGHSCGAVVALGAAPLAQNLARMVLYEPPPNAPVVSQMLLKRLEELAGQGDLARLILEFYEGMGLTSAEIRAEQEMSNWGSRVRAAATIPREIRALQEWTFDPARYRELATPTLLLLGSESADWAREATDNVRSFLRDSRVAVLRGQGHIATANAPELVATKLAEFLLH